MYTFHLGLRKNLKLWLMMMRVNNYKKKQPDQLKINRYINKAHTIDSNDLFIHE